MKYAIPVLLSFNDTGDIAKCKCIPGTTITSANVCTTGPDASTNTCRTGNGATGQCVPGAAANTACKDGSVAGIAAKNCTTGSDAGKGAKGACLSGTTPTN